MPPAFHNAIFGAGHDLDQPMIGLFQNIAALFRR
jgi:hypothetical protein